MFRPLGDLLAAGFTVLWKRLYITGKKKALKMSFIQTQCNRYLFHMSPVNYNYTCINTEVLQKYRLLSVLELLASRKQHDPSTGIQHEYNIKHNKWERITRYTNKPVVLRLVISQTLSYEDNHTALTHVHHTKPHNILKNRWQRFKWQKN